MEYPFQGLGIGYPVVEFTRDIIALYASSVAVRGNGHVSDHHLLIEHLNHMACSTNSNVLAHADGNQQLAFKRAKIYRTEISLVCNLEASLNTHPRSRTGTLETKGTSLLVGSFEVTKRDCRPGLP